MNTTVREYRDINHILGTGFIPLNRTYIIHEALNFSVSINPIDGCFNVRMSDDIAEHSVEYCRAEDTTQGFYFWMMRDILDWYHCGRHDSS